MACEGCTKSKSKCVGGDADIGQDCGSCLKKGRQCTWRDKSRHRATNDLRAVLIATREAFDEALAAYYHAAKLGAPAVPDFWAKLQRAYDAVHAAEATKKAYQDVGNTQARLKRVERAEQKRSVAVATVTHLSTAVVPTSTLKVSGISSMPNDTGSTSLLSSLDPDGLNSTMAQALAMSDACLARRNQSDVFPAHDASSVITDSHVVLAPDSTESYASAGPAIAYGPHTGISPHLLDKTRQSNFVAAPHLSTKSCETYQSFTNTGPLNTVYPSDANVCSSDPAMVLRPMANSTAGFGLNNAEWAVFTTLNNYVHGPTTTTYPGCLHALEPRFPAAQIQPQLHPEMPQYQQWQQQQPSTLQKHSHAHYDVTDQYLNVNGGDFTLSEE